MSRIETSDWGEFRVVDFFERMEHGKCGNVGILMDGTTPYIATSTLNNGHARDVEDPNGLLTSAGNCIALICDGNGSIGRNTYQAEPFTGSVKLMLGYHSRLNQWNGLFLVACLNKSVEVFGYNFAWKRSAETLKAETVRLPITSNGDPDWDYMEHSMRHAMARQETALQALVVAAETPETRIETSGWGKFMLPELFTIDTRSGLDFGKMIPSDSDDAVSFVGRTGVGNGVMGFVERVEGEKLYDAGSMTVALGGSIGACFVQQHDFHISQNVAVLHPKSSIGENAKRFVASIIQKESSLNYKAFVKELNVHLRKDFTLRLPVTTAGDPDWDRMERVMSVAMAERVQVLDALSTLLPAPATA